MSKKRFKFSDFCQSCRIPLGPEEKIVYVEGGTNRFFCSEKCIRSYYDPMSDFYRKHMLEIRDPHDIPELDFAKYESYAPLCLSNPDEIRMDKTENGEQVHIFLSTFTNEGGKFTYIVVCFCLDLEPTYVLLSFPTRDKKLLEEFKRGEKLEVTEASEESSVEPDVSPHITEDLLAKQGNAIEEEMLRHRSTTDVPKDDFEEHSHLLEQTIEEPDEVWELQDEGETTLLTLISQPEENLHYVVICSYDQAQENHEAWRVIYHFPTNDLALLQRYRRGVLREGSDGNKNFLH